MIGRNEDKRSEANAFFLLHKHTHQTLTRCTQQWSTCNGRASFKHPLVKACECEFQIRVISTSAAWVCPVWSAGFYKYSMAPEWKKRNVPDLNSSLLSKLLCSGNTNHTADKIWRKQSINKNVFSHILRNKILREWSWLSGHLLKPQN